MALECLYLYWAYHELVLCDDRPNLSPEEKRRRDRRTPRIAIRRYVDCPFVRLYKSGNDQALLNCCAIDHDSFRDLLHIFEPSYNRYTFDRGTGKIRLKKKNTGKKRDMDAVGALGLVLYWYRTRGSSARAIAWVFGLTSSPMYLWLKFSRRVLLSVLQHHPDAKVLPPTLEQTQQYSAAISERYPALRPKNVWGAIDGLKLRIQQSTNWAIQNQYYNGWTEATYVNSVFVFAPDGKIKMSVINAPGTFHDSTIADYGLYQAMEDVFDNCNDARVVVDAAFNIASYSKRRNPVTGKMEQKDFLLKSSQNLKPKDAISKEKFMINDQATSVRQLAEHGMRMIQGQFPRLKDNIRFEEHDATDRKVCLHLMVLLYNYQTTNTKINTILNSFMSDTEGFKSHSSPEVISRGVKHSVTANADNVFDI